MSVPLNQDNSEAVKDSIRDAIDVLRAHVEGAIESPTIFIIGYGETKQGGLTSLYTVTCTREICPNIENMLEWEAETFTGYRPQLTAPEMNCLKTMEGAILDMKGEKFSYTVQSGAINGGQRDQKVVVCMADNR